MRSPLRVLIGCLSALCLFGCADDTETAACDPLQEHADSSAGSIVIEYLARAPGGELLVVLHPDAHEAVYEEFRLFYGDEEALRERQVRSVQRQRDGGSTHLLFDLDGVEADAYFPVMLSEMGLTLLQATLEADGEVVDLERLEHDAAALDGARFECLR